METLDMAFNLSQTFQARHLCTFNVANILAIPTYGVLMYTVIFPSLCLFRARGDPGNKATDVIHFTQIPSQVQLMSGSYSEMQNTRTTVLCFWRTLVKVMMPCSA